MALGDTLKVVGKWLGQFGETIYGTRGGPIAQHEWGVTTQKNGIVYVHVLNQIDDFIFLPGLGKNISSVQLFQNHETVQYASDPFGIVLRLPEAVRGPIDLVLEIR